RCHSIVVVAPETDHAIMLIQRAENALDGCLHVWKQKRIAQRAETRLQERFDFLRARKAFAHQQPRDAKRAADFSPRNSRRVGIQLFGRRNDPSALPRKASRRFCSDWVAFYAALHRSVYSHQ